MFIMIFVLLFVVMTPISLYLLVKQSGNRLLVWGAFIIFTGGLSGLQVALEKLAIPYLQALEISNPWLTAVNILTALLNITIHSLPYYLILVFFMHYAGYAKQIWIGLLLIPVPFTFIMSDVYPTAQIHYTYILSWGIPYMVGSIALFVKGLLNVEKEKIKKLQHFGIGMIILIPEAFLLLLQMEGIYFQTSVEILIFFPILYLVSLLMGLVLYAYNAFSRFQSATVLTKMQVGTSLMQHAFKNAISKNKLHALNIKRSLESKEYDVVDNQLQSLLKSNDHLMSMVSKLSYLTRRQLSIESELIDISTLLDETIDLFQDTAVTIEKRYGSELLHVDPTLMVECFSNIISNAIEATGGRGKLTITVEKFKRQTRIHFADTGNGMDKEQISKMFEPFYSTKHKSGQNFGLGMFYVKKIMNAHRGKVQVTSQPGKGTIVTLLLF